MTKKDLSILTDEANSLRKLKQEVVNATNEYIAGLNEVPYYELYFSMMEQLKDTNLMIEALNKKGDDIFYLLKLKRNFYNPVVKLD